MEGAAGRRGERWEAEDKRRGLTVLGISHAPSFQSFSVLCTSEWHMPQYLTSTNTSLAPRGGAVKGISESTWLAGAEEERGGNVRARSVAVT